MGLSDAFIFFMQIYIYFLLYFLVIIIDFGQFFMRFTHLGFILKFYIGEIFIFIYLYIYTHTCSCGSVDRALH